MESVQSRNQHNDSRDCEYAQKIQTLEDAIDYYTKALETIESKTEFVTDQEVSDVFAAGKRSHDALDSMMAQSARAKKSEEPSSVTAELGSSREKISLLDARLRKKSKFIQKSIELFNWQKAYLLPDKSTLKLIDPPVAKDRFDLFWRFLSLIFFGISFTLLTDIIKRSLMGGIDASSVIMIVGSTLLSLGSGGVLVQFKEENLRQLVFSFGIPEHWHGRALAGFSALFLSLLAAGWFSLPGLAGWQIDLADKPENLAKREDYYSRAIALDPGNIKAHLGLADLYYEQEEYDKAQEKYKTVWKDNKTKGKEYSYEAIQALEQMTQIALEKEEIDRANQNLKKLLKATAINKKSDSSTDKQLTLIKSLGRIYLTTGKNKNYGEAFRLFKEGYDRAQNNKLRSSMLTYMGWAQMSRKLLADAELTLEDAIQLKEDSAPAHCLLAQVLQQQALTAELTPVKQEKLTQAKDEWEDCRGKNDPNGTRDEVTDWENWEKQATEAVPKIEAQLNTIALRKQ